MPAKTAHRVRIGSLVLASLLTFARAAEPPHPLIGATRDQVLQKLGGPKSQLEAGSRTVLLYQNERIVLRDNLVVEVEPMGSVMVRPSPAPSAEVTVSTGGGSPARAVDVNPSPAVAPAATSAAVAPLETAAMQAGGNEPKVEIKLVRPPSANYTRPTGPSPEVNPRPPQVTAPANPLVATKPVAPVAEPASAAANPKPAAEPVVAPPPENVAKKSADEAAAEQARAEKLAAEAAAKEMKAKAIEATRRRLKDANAQGPEESPISSTLLIAIGAVVVGGLGFVIWRWRQRQFELAATSVQNTPVAPGGGTAVASLAAGSTFTDDYIGQLDPGRFEILVSAYFNKTGVVASRAKAGQGAVAQIRISWKGEPKPFAGVLCIAAPEGAIEAKALMPMMAELEADQIRRGQVVTTGRFSAGAKQFAVEKHLTLLSGESLLEKLNALPESARKDIHNSVLAGENAQPT